MLFNADTEIEEDWQRRRGGREPAVQVQHQGEEQQEGEEGQEEDPHRITGS